MSETMAVMNNFGDKFQPVLARLQRLPFSFWRNIVVAIAAIWAVRSVAALFWLVLPLPSVDQPPKLALPAEAETASQGSSMSYDSLVSFQDVFGKYDASQAAPEPTPPPIAQGEAEVTTKLNLKLHGVFATNEQSKGKAIIGEGSKQTLYSINDEIEGNRGVKLAQVKETRVVLDNRGKLENLWLYSEDDFKASKTAASKPIKPRTTAASSRTSSSNTTRTTARVDQIPKNIGDVVRFSVHREEGKMVGYRIRPGRDRELFNQVGLKANDIVTSVNGIEVNDPKQIRSVYKSMKTATEAQLNVLRDGETHSITISLDSGA